MEANHVGVFILAFICGGVLVYFTAPPTDTIVVYPTPTNIKRVEYRDRAGNCYKYSNVLGVAQFPFLCKNNLGGI